MKKLTVRQILNYSPKIYGLAYLGLIPLFALIFWLMPTDDFKTELNMNYFLTCLYYSTVTITTLGFGDISPVGQLSQVFTITESIFGLVIIGLFLNSIAHLKSSIDVAEEKKKNELRKYKQEREKLLRHNKIIQANIDYYIMYTSIVTKPMKSRTTEGLNKDFVFNDLQDLFLTTMRMTDNHFEPAISYYFKHQKILEVSINEMLLTVDFSYWNDLENLCFSFLDICKKLDYSTHILNQPNTRLGTKKGSESDAEMIKKHTGEVKFLRSNAINAYVALYYLIKANIDFVDNYRKLLDDIKNETKD